MDDKGPTIAAYYAVKILNEMNVNWKKRIHIIIGTDEESDWKCTDRYFETEEMPVLGFAPDAEFPAIHGEKGISTFDVIQNDKAEDQDEPEYNYVHLNLVKDITWFQMKQHMLRLKKI